MEEKIKKKKKIICNLIKFIEKKKINYCFLGNIKNIFNDADSDIDIFIQFKDKKYLYNIIKEFCIKNNLKIVNIFQHEVGAFYFVLIYKNQFNKNQFILLDICNEYVAYGHKLIDFINCTKKNILKLKNVRLKILEPKDQLKYYLLKKIIKNDFNDTSYKYIFSLVNKMKKIKLLDLNNNFNNYFSIKIINALKKCDKKFFTKNIKVLQRNIYSTKPLRFVDLKDILMRKLSRIANPTGLFVVFLGCDGSGKSTIINMLLKDYVFLNGFRKKEYFHLYPLFKNKKQKKLIVKNPHAQNEYNFFISFIKIVYLYILFLFGYFINIRPLLVTSTLVLFDRFIYDITVDPKRFRLKVPLFLLKLTCKILPKPDLIFILDSKIETLNKKKQEVEKNMLINLKSKYLKLKTEFKNVYIIDNSKSLSSTYNKVLEKILKKLISKNI